MANPLIELMGLSPEASAIDMELGKRLLSIANKPKEAPKKGPLDKAPVNEKKKTGTKVVTKTEVLQAPVVTTNDQNVAAGLASAYDKLPFVSYPGQEKSAQVTKDIAASEEDIKNIINNTRALYASLGSQPESDYYKQKLHSEYSRLNELANQAASNPTRDIDYGLLSKLTESVGGAKAFDYQKPVSEEFYRKAAMDQLSGMQEAMNAENSLREKYARDQMVGKLQMALGQQVPQPRQDTSGKGPSSNIKSSFMKEVAPLADLKAQLVDYKNYVNQLYAKGKKYGLGEDDARLLAAKVAKLLGANRKEDGTGAHLDKLESAMIKSRIQNPFMSVTGLFEDPIETLKSGFRSGTSASPRDSFNRVIDELISDADLKLNSRSNVLQSLEPEAAPMVQDALKAMQPPIEQKGSRQYRDVIDTSEFNRGPVAPPSESTKRKQELINKLKGGK